MSGRHSRRPAHRRLLPGAAPAWTGPGRPRPGRPGRAARPAELAGTGPAGTIFRAEALESRARGADLPDVVLRLGAPWLRWFYALALGLVAAGVLLAVTARTPEESYGTAIVSEPGGQFAALLPVAAAGDLSHRGGPMAALLAVSARPVRITITQLRLASPALAKQAGLGRPAQLSILLTGRLAPGTELRPADGRMRTAMALVVGSKTVGSIVLGELEVMFGKDQAGS